MFKNVAGTRVTRHRHVCGGSAATRAQAASAQVAGIGATLSVLPFCSPQHPCRSAPSYLASRVTRQVEAIADRECRGSSRRRNDTSFRATSSEATMPFENWIDLQAWRDHARRLRFSGNHSSVAALVQCGASRAGEVMVKGERCVEGRAIPSSVSRGRSPSTPRLHAASR